MVGAKTYLLATSFLHLPIDCRLAIDCLLAIDCRNLVIGPQPS